MLTIDGSFGEGGGQILRSAAALSMLTGRPFRIEKIRAGRKKPGIMRQHLTAIQAAAKVCGAQVDGAEIGSGELTFAPGEVQPGDYRFSVGSAGSTSLVLETVLPPLLVTARPSRLHLEGGTHNPFAPPFDFLSKTFLPLLNRMGPRVSARLERHGFYPAGGGSIQVSIEPAKLTGFDLLDRGKILGRRATAYIARLPRHIAEREIRVVGRALRLEGSSLEIREIAESRGPGNAVVIEIESEHVTEVFTGFGERGVRAETVAEKTAQEASRYSSAGVPVGEHLADQLILPFAMAGSGSFMTLPLSSHAKTHMDLVWKFLDVEVKISQLPDDRWVLTVGR